MIAKGLESPFLSLEYGAASTAWLPPLHLPLAAPPYTFLCLPEITLQVQDLLPPV